MIIFIERNNETSLESVEIHDVINCDLPFIYKYTNLIIFVRFWSLPH